MTLAEYAILFVLVVATGAGLPGPGDASLIAASTLAGEGRRSLAVTFLSYCAYQQVRGQSHAQELEPVIGFEPMACRLQEARPRAPFALAALAAHVIALKAFAAPGLSRAPFHETFHAHGMA